MDPKGRGGESPDKITTLQALLKTARGIAEDLSAAADALLVRWNEVFQRMPPEDRRPVLEIVEREVGLRLIERSGSSISGFTIVKANPNARLYVRAFGPQRPYHDRDDIMRATLRAARMMLILPPEFHDAWEEATLDAFRALSPEEREAVARHNREILALLERTQQTTAKTG